MARLFLAVCMVLALVSPALAAEVTVTLAEIDESRVRVEADYDDQSGRISLVRVVNASAQAVHISAIRISDGRIVSQRFPAGSTTTRSFPQNPASERFVFTITPRGLLDGIEFQVLWPYP